MKPEHYEWDREFAIACNAALPFERCAAHLGSEGWGDDGRRYSDLQVRAYDLADPPIELEKQIIKGATLAVKPDEVARESDGEWRRILVSYERIHFDYSATAHVDFRLRRFGDRTLVLVFMYTSYPGSADAIPSILGTVRRERQEQ